MIDQELERFKAEIDLCAFAASRGYRRDAAESSLNCEVMRTENGDKIIIIKHLDNKGAEHWVYYCVRDARDNGTIIDFLQWRGGGTLGQIRKILRGWTGTARPDVPTYDRPHRLRPVSRDRAGVMLAWEKARAARESAYLSGRGIGPDVLALPALAGSVRVDDRGNALFAHHDKGGLCGFEIKNHGFTGFSAGGVKGLWFSKATTSARLLVFCESAIDGISYLILNGGGEEMRVMSMGGTLNPDQPALIRSAMEKMPAGSRVLLAFDADEGGDKLAEEVRALTPNSVEILRALPPVGMGKDWNEALKLQRRIIEHPDPRQVRPDHGEHRPLSPSS